MSETGATIESRQRGADWRAIVLIVAAVVAVAGLGGLATDPDSSWYRQLDRPSWQPPSSVFAPVWTVLYVLIAGSMIVAWHRTSGATRRSLFTWWGMNLVLNLAWTVIFFRSHSPVVAGIEIVVLEVTTVVLIFRTWPVSKPAASVLIPYAIWVAFATALTWTIALSN